MKPAKTVTNTLQNSLGERLDEFSRLFSKAQKKLKRGTVHDLRSSSRKLIAALELFEPLETPVRIGKTCTDLKDLLHAMRDLRDLQVEEKRVKSENPRSEAKSFISELRTCEKREKCSVSDTIAGFNLRRVEREVRSLIDFLGHAVEMEPGFERDLRELCNQHLRDRYKKVVESIEALPERCPPPLAIHEVRIRFKQFRYSWDLVSPHLGSARRAEKALKEFQTLLGGIQDLHVLLSTLVKFAHRELNPYARNLSRQQKRLIGEFQQTYPSFLSVFKTPLARGISLGVRAS